ncbi:hypothetical protein [Nonomuraea sp. bgisy101]|uniref:hypothetical protein n=1 Tax=Nonomuraea sp. bgisy101 TaxID=3413784 RepID=UPI003D7255D8
MGTISARVPLRDDRPLAGPAERWIAACAPTSAEPAPAPTRPPRRAPPAAGGTPNLGGTASWEDAVGRRPTIDRAELERLVGAGMSVRELAAHFGVSESGVLQAKRAAGLAKPQLDHGGALPWTLSRTHAQSGPATNLRNLSAAAQGARVAPERLNTALRWARRLVEQGLDVAYDPVEGFTEVPAPPSGSHVAEVLGRAVKVLEAD